MTEGPGSDIANYSDLGLLSVSKVEELDFGRSEADRCGKWRLLAEKLKAAGCEPTSLQKLATVPRREHET
jgi:hypothetical protein